VEPELRIQRLELQEELLTHLRGVREVRKALAFAAGRVQSVLAVRAAAVAARRPDGGARILHATFPDRSPWDLDLFAAYLAGDRPRIPPHLALAPVERRGRNWAVLAVHDPDREFGPGHRELLFGVAGVLSDIVGGIDGRKLRDTRRRIENKIADRQDFKDLIYDILHGILSLTRYDHSSALLLSAADGQYELAAEQIAYAKAKSRSIGARYPWDSALDGVWVRGEVLRFTRSNGGWTGDADPGLASFLESVGEHGDGPPQNALLCAPILTPGDTRGMLKVASGRPDLLGAYEAELVREFLPLASLAIQFSRRAETLQERILESERKHILATLTQGTSHDVNNALGSVIPLIQQIRADADRGDLDPKTLRADLDHIERSLQTCRRIFGGMLSVARGAGRPVGTANLRRAIDTAVSVLEERLRRHGVTLELDLPREIPEVGAGQNDVTQLFLNLFGNADEAMPRGGTLSVTVVPRDDRIAVRVADTGVGIPTADRARIFESFYSTKPEGTGLGLTVVSSVVRRMGGTVSVESQEGEGTAFLLDLPVARGEAP